MRFRTLLLTLPLLFVGLGCSSENSETCPSDHTCPTCPEVDAGKDVQVADHFSSDVPLPKETGPDSPLVEAAVDAHEEENEVPVDGLRIMSFNIRHGADSSLEAIAEFIRQESPDIVGLQEVDSLAERSNKVDQAHKLSQLTGLTSVFHSSLTFSSGGYYGLALLSRFPIISSKKRQLTSTGEQRIVMTAELLTDHGTVPVAVTHLGLSSAERVGQVNEILEDLGSRTNAILMGDMNAKPDSPEMQALAGVLVDAWGKGDGGYTFPVDVPNRRIDFVFLGSDWPKPTEVYVPNTKTSDHLPVVVDVPWF